MLSAAASRNTRWGRSTNITREDAIVADLKRCERGHFYDPMKFTRCPFDGVESIDFGEEEKEPSRGDDRPTPAAASEGMEVDPATRRLGIGGPALHGGGTANPGCAGEIHRDVASRVVV